jgi:O-antigen ligase
MTAVELESSAYGAEALTRGLVVRLSRGTLFVLLFVIYIGALPFFISFSPALLYGTYVVYGLCAVGFLSFEWKASRNLLSTVLYLAWLLIFYCCWGALVAGEDVSLSQVARLFLKNVLVISLFELAVIDRQGIARAADCFQLGALFNLAIAFRELWDPKLVLKLALTLDPDASSFNELRPAGLWSNPNEAAFSFIFAFLISYWARGPLAWIGRLSCLLGIFLSASRTGMYVLTLCGAIYLVLNLRSTLFNYRRLTALFLGAGALAAAVAVFAGSSTLRILDLSNQWQLNRLLDFSETTSRGAKDSSRLEIAQKAIQRALERPWTGHGIFSFQGASASPTKPGVLSTGVHNVYIAVWGETGIPGLITFLLLLAIGVRRLFNRQIARSERLILLLMWISYLVIGFAWHNQFSGFSGMLFIALLYHLPSVVGHYAKTAPMVDRWAETAAC